MRAFFRNRLILLIIGLSFLAGCERLDGNNYVDMSLGVFNVMEPEMGVSE